MWTLGLTYLIFWGPLAIFQIPGASAGQQGGVGMGILPFIVGGFVPSIVGIVLTAKFEGRPGLRQLWRRLCALRFSLRWYLVILAVPILASGARLVVQWATGADVHPAEPLAAILANPVLWIPFTIQVIFLGPLSEEFGWRGFAQDRLLARFSPLSGSLLLGLVWACWHIPLFFIPGTSQSAGGQPSLQFAVFAIGVISESVILTWLYNRTGRSLGAAVLMHATIGFTGSLVALLVPPSLIGDAMFAAGHLVVAAVVTLISRGDLGAGNVPARNAGAAVGSTRSAG
ncbi:MAG TPA: type II CAAX endopeptidase family protein [Symbiobacteriaceae bacterium]|nr:type II CAAX endopeptidase family protein [Symbiobacteriaceae bacterium]